MQPVLETPPNVLVKLRPLSVLSGTKERKWTSHIIAGLGHAQLGQPVDAVNRPAQVTLGKKPYRRTPGTVILPLATG